MLIHITVMNGNPLSTRYLPPHSSFQNLPNFPSHFYENGQLILKNLQDNKNSLWDDPSTGIRTDTKLNSKHVVKRTPPSQQISSHEKHHHQQQHQHQQKAQAASFESKQSKAQASNSKSKQLQWTKHYHYRREWSSHSHQGKGESSKSEGKQSGEKAGEKVERPWVAEKFQCEVRG